ncbi:hypothetical protein GA0070624_3196 [Micromonospora rhizosphaerae]|uniref:Uncharacterized protein n=1 Tax=Micromonospora rhizosphaerae TaxID=568872 RepID=A0A1C6S8R3_9ACTN|nr:hypothetical protein GA0070624_3196 [Micromonospora rhizosphaerae]
MAKNNCCGNSGKSGSDSGGVSSARLRQNSDSSNEFGGYTKGRFSFAQAD